MATLDLIGSSAKLRALLDNVDLVAPVDATVLIEGENRAQTKAAVQKRFRLTARQQPLLEDDIRREERCRERARIVHELHDTLLQGFLGASMLLYQAVEQMPADSPSKPALCRALRLVRRAIDEGRTALRGLHAASPSPSSLEQAFSNFLAEVTPARGVRLRIFVQGSRGP